MVFSITDIIIVVVILFLAMKGLITGFAKEFFYTVGIVGGIYTASHFSYSTAEIIKSKLFPTVSITTLKFIAFIVILAVVWWSILAIGKFIDSTREDGISLASSIGGYITALFKYFIVISLILFVLMQIPSIRSKNFGKSIVSSKIYPYMKNSASWILNGSRVIAKQDSTTVVK